MATSPVVIEDFPGLNLSADPTIGSPDMLNVTFDRPGSIRTRDGTSKYTPSALSLTGVNALSATPQAGITIAAYWTTAGSTFVALDAAGAPITSTTRVIFTEGLSFQQYGPNAAISTYIANGASTLFKYSPIGFTVPAFTGGFTPVGNHLAAWQDRLVLANSIGNESRVWFSEPGDPLTWTYSVGPPETGNFVDLDPSDQEKITGVATYRDQLIVFKQTKFFVFYSTSTDSTGGAVFNYRSFRLGYGAIRGSVLSTPIGVCFVNTEGVWSTQGGNPQKLSGDIDGLFYGSASTLWTDTGLTAPVRLCWHENRLLVGSTASKKVLVWDGTRWSAWQLSGGRSVDAMLSVDLTRSITATSRPTLLLGSSSQPYVYELDPSVSTDDGAAMPASYTSPFMSFGNQDVKKPRDTIIQGVGTPSVAMSADFATFPAASPVKLGTSPYTGEGRDRSNPRGRQLAFKLSSSSGAWRVDRLTMNLEQGRGQGEKP